MKKSQYYIDHKVHCNFCKTSVVAYIEKIEYKKTKTFSYASYCPKCGRYIENIPANKTKIKKGTK